MVLPRQGLQLFQMKHITSHILYTVYRRLMASLTRLNTGCKAQAEKFLKEMASRPQDYVSLGSRMTTNSIEGFHPGQENRSHRTHTLCLQDKHGNLSQGKVVTTFCVYMYSIRQDRHHRSPFTSWEADILPVFLKLIHITTQEYNEAAGREYYPG